MIALRERADPPRPVRVRRPVTCGDTCRDRSDLSLWRSYRQRRDQGARGELLERHLPLVRILARRLGQRIGGVVELDDLMSAGTIGLVQALESFDLNRPNSFATYASRRIHGAMLDELRRRDWVPRSVRCKARKLQQAGGKIESILGRAPAPEEMAAMLQIDLPTYWSWRATVDGAVQVSFEDPATPEDGEVEVPEGEDPLDLLAREEQVGLLASAIAGLPERERRVLALYYYEDLNLREIASILRLTESRISQIRTAALTRLRGFLSREVA